MQIKSILFNLCNGKNNYKKELLYNNDIYIFNKLFRNIILLKSLNTKNKNIYGILFNHNRQEEKKEIIKDNRSISILKGSLFNNIINNYNKTLIQFLSNTKEIIIQNLRKRFFNIIITYIRKKLLLYSIINKIHNKNKNIIRNALINYKIQTKIFILLDKSRNNKFVVHQNKIKHSSDLKYIKNYEIFIKNEKLEGCFQKVAQNNSKEHFTITKDISNINYNYINIYNRICIINKIINLSINKNKNKSFFDNLKIKKEKQFEIINNTKYNHNNFVITKIIDNINFKGKNCEIYIITKVLSFSLNNKKISNNFIINKVVNYSIIKRQIKDNIAQTDLSLIKIDKDIEMELEDLVKKNFINIIKIDNSLNYKPKGLINLGSTCYLNSLLQCLYYIKDFRNYFLNGKFNKLLSMCLSLKDVMNGLNRKGDEKYYKPEKIKTEINDISMFENGKAADVTDLLDFIFERITEESIADDSSDKTVSYEENFDNKYTMYRNAFDQIDFNNIINKLFVGFYEREFKCQKGHLKYSFLSEYKINFPLEKIYQYSNKKNYNLDIYDCFDYYQRIQNNGDSGECYKCGQKSILIEKIYRTPKILILTLDRGYNKTFKKTVEFYKYIDLKKYIDDKKYEYPTKYKLIGVSTHLGRTGQYGHYISFCLCDDNNYYYLNDSLVKKMQKNDNHTFYQDSPYILFYQRVERINKYKEIIDDIKVFLDKTIQKINESKNDISLYLENKDIYKNVIIYKEKLNKLIFKFDHSEFSEQAKNLNIQFSFKKNPQGDNLSYSIYTKYYWNKNISLNENKEIIKTNINYCFEKYKRQNSCILF